MRSLLAAVLLLAVPAVVACRPAVTPPPEFQPPVLVPPLCDAAVGERLVTERGAERWEYTVVSAAETEVVVEVVKSVQGAPQSRPQRFTYLRNGFGLPDHDVILRIEPDRLEVGGRSWDCWLLQVENKERGRFFYWVSPEVAVHGILKIAKSDGGVPEEPSAIRWAGDSLSGE